jgi:hypothetical protein
LNGHWNILSIEYSNKCFQSSDSKSNEAAIAVENSHEKWGGDHQLALSADE